MMQRGSKNHLLIFLFLFVPAVASESELCKDFELRSQPLQHQSAFIRDAKGNPGRIKNVTLVEQLSEAACVKWDNYAHVGSTVIVKDGCQGKFTVCYFSGVSPPVVPITQSSDCVTVRLNSTVKEPQEKMVLRSDGRGDLIVSMTLVQSFSAVSCVLGHSFGFYGHKVEAKYGCKGEFRVCVDPLIILDSPKEDFLEKSRTWY